MRLLLFLICAVLAARGQSGQLYLPDDAPSESATAESRDVVETAKEESDESEERRRGNHRTCDRGGLIVRDVFLRHHDELFAEKIPVAALADRFGTPVSVYSRARLEHH